MRVRDPSRVVVFDFDGTLVSRDSVLDFCFRYAARRPHRLLLVLAVTPLAALGRLRSVGAAASVLLWALTVGTSTRFFVGELRRYAEQVLPRFAYEELFAELSRELSMGRDVVIATGALPALVRGVLRARGLPRLPIVGSRLRRRYGGLTVVTHCVGSAKARELSKRFGIQGWRAVYTDSWADRCLMRGARDVTLVSPSPELLERARKLSGERSVRVSRPQR
jgi:phosphatidylglycerophosphatase C